MPNLTAETAQTVTRPGLHRAGKRLYLQVSQQGAKSWIFRYSVGGRIRSMGLGPFPDVTISKAKQKADKQNALLADGRDPMAERALARANLAKTAKAQTFKEFAPTYVEAQKAGWKNAKHRAQWSSSLENDAYPILGDLAVPAITVDHVLSVLRPIWTTKHESALRLRGRIAKVLGAAKAQGLREGPNPAAWTDNLEHLLPKISRSRRIKHFRALKYQSAPDLMAALRKRNELTAMAARFVLLTLCRTTEMRLAVKSEIDRDAREWIIPANRTKNSKPHRVPLCDEALQIIETVWKLPGEWLFPGRKGKPMSDGAVLMLLERMGYRTATTTHGLRSTFRDWAAEETSYPREVCERMLAHTVEDETELSYMRGDHIKKRNALMTDWATFLGPKIEQQQAAE